MLLNIKFWERLNFFYEVFFYFNGYKFFKKESKGKVIILFEEYIRI